MIPLFLKYIIVFWGLTILTYWSILLGKAFKKDFLEE